jgi:chemotaxis protein MotB
MARPPSEDASGFPVYPKMQVPPQRPSGGDVERPTLRRRLSQRQKLIAITGGAIVFGALVGWLIAPSKAGELADTKEKLEGAQKAATVATERATTLDKKVETLQKAKDYTDKQLADATTKAKDVDKKADEVAALEKKLQAAVDKSQGSVTTEGGEIHLKLVDKLMFAVGDDKLTTQGKNVLDKLAPVLNKDFGDKQVWVQGHTDDQPIYAPPPKKDAAKPNPKDKTKKPPPKGGPAPVAPVRPTTNWELSAERALSVVHYLQDHGKVDPSRLAALAFGQYHPVSRSNKAANRRIEIVLVPRKEVLQK